MYSSTFLPPRPPPPFVCLVVRMGSSPFLVADESVVQGTPGTVWRVTAGIGRRVGTPGNQSVG